MSNTPKDQSSRIIWVDYLETIAIFLVVAYHCTSYIANSLFVEAHGWTIFYYFLRSIAAVCVPLFFFVNGFLLLRHPFDLKRHLFKTLKFLFIALFWYALTLGFLVFIHRDMLSSNSLLSVISSVKYGINHLWYLGALICIYILFPLMKVVYDHNRKVFIYFTIICAVITFGNTILNHLFTFVVHFIFHQEIIYSEVNFLSIFNPFRGIYGYTFVFFCLGGIIATYIDKIIAITKKTRNLIAVIGLIVSWLGLFGLGLLYSKASGQIWDNVWYGYDTIFALIATLAIFLLSLNLARPNHLIELISRNTLGIYLVHMLIIYAFMACFGEFVKQYLNPLSLSAPFIIILVSIMIYAIVVVFISFFISIIFRKIPYIKKLIS